MQVWSKLFLSAIILEIMRSLRTKIALLNIIAIATSITIATVIGAVSIATFGHESSEKELALLCETGKSNINNYLKSVEQSANTVSHLIDEDLNTIDPAHYDDELPHHVERATKVFLDSANNTAGVFTFYYRFDPTVTSEEGFWYTKENGITFERHEVTDISDDHFECPWYWQPKTQGKAIWLLPYETENLWVPVISYNVPVYHNQDFVGVVGMEIKYTTLGTQIDSIKVSKSGYAFVVEDENGTIIFHPELDILSMKKEDRPSVPSEFLRAFKNGEHHCEYEFMGVKKHSYWLNLSNNMSIVVAVPFSEVNQAWIYLIILFVVAGVVLIGVFTLLTILSSRRITKPLKELTIAAEEINNGNYQVNLSYNGDDEIGMLTNTMNNLVKNLEEYISDLNNLAYADPLTSVANKSAFDILMGQ